MVNTRAKRREITPDGRGTQGEYDTPTRNSFFNAFDNKSPRTSISAIERRLHIGHGTGSKWLKDRDKFGFNGYYRVRKVSNNLGPHPRHSPRKFKALVDPAQNPVRNQRYEAQIAFHDLHLKPRQLRYNLEKYTNKGRRYKQAYVQKEISKPNRIKRVDYGQTHENETVDSFWQFCLFTDEAHFDPASQGTGRILREQGQRYNPENIQEKPALLGNKVHFSGWVNWHAKCDKLEFYNDEEEYVEKPRRPRKPRKSRYETEEDWNKRLMEWEAQIGHEKVVKPKGNSMTQEYYVKRLLPHYIDAIKDLSKKHSAPISQWRLIEDGDGSHGEMPTRCKQLIKGNGSPVKSSLW
ncbi:phosphoribosylformylglycinamidine cyclo-ligase protein [Rutstroemia sp. NJR-2017a BBW]|nr:phosphoribosylformylglycinamidine cyclo-ligase protein [Rutstroemia sp. NJR-2017a BBW]